MIIANCTDLHIYIYIDCGTNNDNFLRFFFHLNIVFLLLSSFPCSLQRFIVQHVRTLIRCLITLISGRKLKHIMTIVNETFKIIINNGRKHGNKIEHFF